ncbi:MAG TPA: arsenosugar biosynthesis radical SAM (seleno)protein ArsS [Usitatibacter sp.]|nr:arsenosugar biosynthesis radical SAM (seleno)protein ArsS [Usitatibacter sp.]
MHATLPLLAATNFPPIARRRLETLQVNVGYVCNQSCLHCHVNAGPTRTEAMTRETADEVLAYLGASGAATLDITGGAPELNANFRHLVLGARMRGVKVMDRCNLTVLLEPGQEDTAEFLAANRVDIVASLPCYTEELVDRQRGEGVYGKSIAAIRRLNALGYGREASGLALDFVYNPQGPSLPPAQAALEGDYKRILGEKFGIVFNRLYTLANMPIQRFGSTLVTRGQFGDYMKLLRGSHSDANLEAVMCRSLVSVDWQGYLYDCDFNQMLGLPLRVAGRARLHVRDAMERDLEGNPIVVRDHCYGCTAGQGSSCGGALA